MTTLYIGTLLMLALAVGVQAQSTSYLQHGESEEVDQTMWSVLLAAVEDLRQQNHGLQADIRQLEILAQGARSVLDNVASELNSTSTHSSESSWVRLVNGTNSTSGRLEVMHNCQWGTVCDDDFGSTDAQVFCKTLRMPWRNASAVKSSTYFGTGSGPIWLDQVGCSGSEVDASDCGHSSWGEEDCSHVEDVGLICV